MDSTNKDQLSQDIVNILANRGWQLVAPDSNKAAWHSFVERVARFLNESKDSGYSPEKRLDRAVMGAYCEVLYHACTQEGAQQGRAYEELWRWVYPRVRSHISTKEDAEDIAQEVLTAVYAQIKSDITNPRGLLAWVNRITFYKCMDHYRDPRNETSIEEGRKELEASGYLTISEEEMFRDINRATKILIKLLEECMPGKAKKQKYAFIQLVLFGKSVSDVAQALHIKPNAVHALKHNAKQNILKHCPKLLEILLELLTPSQRAGYAEGNQ